jgi:type II secretory pathway predicted ATPase ExeA
MLRQEGPVAVLGAPGLGKSLLAELVDETLCDRMDVVKLQTARICSRQALLQSILYELQMPYRELSEGELRLSILDRLEPSPETAPEGILIVVDEAHTLHPKLLDELRLLTNFSRNGQSRAQLLLLGNLRLEDSLANPILESLSQRLAARVFLEPMNREETANYIVHHLRMIEQTPEMQILESAIKAVFAASQGIPRLVNQIMDQALVLATHRSVDSISIELINESWGRVQQLPALWDLSNAKPDVQASSHTVEFGSLDEEPMDARATQISSSSWVAETSYRMPIIGDPLREGADEEGSARTEVTHNFFSAFSFQDLDDESLKTLDNELDCRSENAHESSTAHYEDTSSDLMSVWENDPPLCESLSNPNSQLSGHGWDFDSEERTEELFGNDFELEQSIPSQGSIETTCEEHLGPSPIRGVGQIDSPGDDYLNRLQETTECLSEASQIADLEFCAADFSPPAFCSGSNLQDPNWSIHIVADSSGTSIEESIEDIVSQLNFSAFMVEPFSVEQIPLKAKGSSGPFDPNTLADLEVPEGIRVNEQQQVLMLHRPIEEFPFTGVNEEYDDDRDLLILEEQIPASSQMLNQSLPSEPAQRPAPYAQLFSRLRR